jgi:hypothetical protein
VSGYGAAAMAAPLSLGAVSRASCARRIHKGSATTQHMCPRAKLVVRLKQSTSQIKHDKRGHSHCPVLSQTHRRLKEHHCTRAFDISMQCLTAMLTAAACTRAAWRQRRRHSSWMHTQRWPTRTSSCSCARQVCPNPHCSSSKGGGRRGHKHNDGAMAVATAAEASTAVAQRRDTR